MGRLTKRHGKYAVQIGGETRRHDEAWLKLAHFEDLEEQGELVEVIRCKGCDMSYYSESGKNLWCGVFDKIVEEDGFCWLGDKKVGAK